MSEETVVLPREQAYKLLFEKYRCASLTHSDIHEHVPILQEYASRCNSILEAGVRSGVSSWAFLTGLCNHMKMQKLHSSSSTESQKTPLLVSIDIESCPNIQIISTLASSIGIQFKFWQGNDLNYPLDSKEDKFDIVFIDTWHVYGQLKRELAKFAPVCNQYIIMHDTQVDEFAGESIRCGHDIIKEHQETGFSIGEIASGLRPAIIEFLYEHPEFKIEKRLTNNNGLTILQRVINAPKQEC